MIKGILQFLFGIVILGLLYYLFYAHDYDNLMVYSSDNKSISFLDNNKIAASANGEVIHARSLVYIEPGCYQTSGFYDFETGEYVISSFKQNTSDKICK